MELRIDERFDPSFKRKAGEQGGKDSILQVHSVEEMAQLVARYAGTLEAFYTAQSDPTPVQNSSAPDTDKAIVPEE